LSGTRLNMMKRIHFIAIGGAAMHNLALALHDKGYLISGSDDEIAEPSRSRLLAAGLLPGKTGWHTERISEELDAIILGMHARKDNPELIKAIELRIKIYSYPEFLYEQTKNKTRVVIAGSHGKTTITSMVMHVLQKLGRKFDYMVGAKIEGFDTMVSLEEGSEVAVFEGDEYLSSPVDLRPKFIHYKPDIALINGIAWDHINVFPTFEIYKKQFSQLIRIIEPAGILIYNEEDSVVSAIVQSTARDDIQYIPFKIHPVKQAGEISYLQVEGREPVPLQIFGDHNMKNIAAARAICSSLQVTDDQFYKAIVSFKGSAKRLEKLFENESVKVFLDFAHAPSKLQATVHAVKKQFPGHALNAIFELHTFSSLNKDFLKDYKGTMNEADHAIIYFNPKVVEHKKLEPLSIEDVQKFFDAKNAVVVTDVSEISKEVKKLKAMGKLVFLFMSSGNFGGKKIDEIIEMCV
jgi:UDP-N-acetylmuramate: L-alanyl-gamma-D-glutamyl-meso-diaminopimelate ligase